MTRPRLSRLQGWSPAYGTAHGGAQTALTLDLIETAERSGALIDSSW
jgi:hypothetical protein